MNASIDEQTATDPVADPIATDPVAEPMATDPVAEPMATDPVAEPMATDPVAVALLNFLESRTRARWEPDVDLFAAGAVSSLFAMELVVYLEKTFGVTVGPDDLVLANFRSVRSMTALVHRLRAVSGE